MKSKVQMVFAAMVVLFATFAPALAHASGMPTHKDHSPRTHDRGAHPHQG
jgi:hypothetical protein